MHDWLTMILLLAVTAMMLGVGVQAIVFAWRSGRLTVRTVVIGIAGVGLELWLIWLFVKWLASSPLP